jgi:hypothetical protein
MRPRRALGRGHGPSRRTPLRPGGHIQRHAGLRRAGFTGASPAQRREVAPQGCLACGGRPWDPAHLVPRATGGCDHADCVVPLCRACHRGFDDGRLELLRHLEPRFRSELAHALSHASLAWLVARVTAGRWRLVTPARDGGEGGQAA